MATGTRALTLKLIADIDDFNKNLNKGSTEVEGFGGKIEKFGKVAAAAFAAAAAAAVAYAGKLAIDGVKAAIEDEAAQVRLAGALERATGATRDQIAAVEQQITKTALATGVADDQLRPALARLAVSTGDTAKAQDLLNLSLDIAAGSGQDLLTVNQDLAGAVVGNTKGLRKYNLGLTQTELKTLDFNKAVTLLTKTFAGAGAAELETYSGKMRVLREAADNAQEIIGKGLVDALSKLGDDDSVNNLAKSMEDVAEYTADVIRGLGVLAAKLKALPGAGALDIGMIPILGSYLEALAALGKVGPQPFTTPMTISGSTDAQVKADKARAAAAAAAAKREKERLALLKKQELVEKNKISLSKAAAVFDSDRISIAAALRATYDKETILRLQALQAIEEDNGDLALKKIGELAAFQKNADLAKLAGITQISEAALAAINTQLLTELKAINDSKMAESDKEAARQIAFGKYNAAITAAGDLAAKESYSERVQIQLTEIARLASLSKTSNAGLTLTKLLESAELSMIERVAAAQKRADDARLKALQEYAAALGKIGTSASTDGVAKDGTFGAKSAEQLAADAALKKFFEEQLAKETAAAKAADEALKAQLEKVSLDTIVKAETDAVIELLEATAARADAFTLLTDDATKAVADYLAGDPFKNRSGLIDTETIARTSFLAGLSGGAGVSGAASGARYAAQAARAYYITINAGAIASKDEFTSLLQETIQKINRDGDPLFVAGTI